MMSSFSRGWMSILWWLALLVASSGTVSGLVIHEIMYDPPGSDNNLEYVEFYSEEEMNLSGWVFEDSQSSDVLRIVQASDYPYILIVEEGFNVTGINASVYSAGATLGNNLNNDGDTVLLRDASNTIVDSISYVKGDGGSGTGTALCVENRLLIECLPTPGEENVINSTEEEGGDPPQNDTGQDSYGMLRINEILPDPSGDDGGNMPQGEWVELYHEGSPVDVAGLEVCDSGNHCVIITNSHVTGDTLMSDRDFLVVYMNGESLLNNKGYEEVLLVDGDVLLDQVSYSGSDVGLSWSFIDDGFYLTPPTPDTENRLHAGDLIKQNEKDVSYFTVDSIKPNTTLFFGDVLTATISVYRADTSQKTLYAYVTGASKKSSAAFHTKDTSYEVSLPVMSPPDCAQQSRNQTYYLIVEGFGLKKEIPLFFSSRKGCLLDDNATLTSKTSENIINRATPASSTTNVSRRQHEKISTEPFFKVGSGDAIMYAGFVFALALVSGFAYYLLRK